jgi:hypothetical protein
MRSCIQMLNKLQPNLLSAKLIHNNNVFSPVGFCKLQKCIYEDVISFEAVLLYQNFNNNIIHNMHFSCTFHFFFLCICACLGDDRAFNLIFLYSNISVHISHICASGICTNYSSLHSVISHHLSPPPVSPLCSPQ